MAKKKNDVRAQSPKVYTIPSSANFLTTLAENLLNGKLIPGFKLERKNWSELAETTIYLPTRQSARTLTEIFREIARGKVVILPRILPLGDIDELHIALHPNSTGERLPLAMSQVERQIAMTRLILGWSESYQRSKREQGEKYYSSLTSTPTDAAWLAMDLLNLMDQVETEEVNWSQLANIVPEDHAEYWQMTIDFLKIATEVWPAHLKEQGRMDPSKRRSELIRIQAELFENYGSQGPVIVAGSTGTVPATAQLLKIISKLPNGAVVLPGVDYFLDETSWDLLDISAKSDQQNTFGKNAPTIPTHPQYGMAKLLKSLGVKREEVVSLCESESDALKIRDRMVSESLRPVETTDQWVKLKQDLPQAERDLAFKECVILEPANEIEEGLAISLVLREALENGKNSALVTSDGALARRVISELRRWSITASDSSGIPLIETPVAVTARLVNKTALHGFEPVALLSLLKHRNTRLGMKSAELNRARRELEKGILRGPRPNSGISGLEQAISAESKLQVENSHTPVWRKLSDENWNLVIELVNRLKHCLQPLESLEENVEISISELASCTLESLRRIGMNENDELTEIFEGIAAEAFVKFLGHLIEEDNSGLKILPRDWPSLFKTLMMNVSIHDPLPSDPRISIFAPPEFRLHRPDVVVLAGLNEGNWPSTTRNDPWLNRPMKSEMGLEQPERRIGLSAHDFTQGMSVSKVILSRTLRSGGAPTVASRWIQRLTTVAGDTVVSKLRKEGQKYLDWARQMDESTRISQPSSPPCPKPPVEFRPKKLSVTEIETWIRDPYAIYARRILKLEPMEPIGGRPGAAEKGTIIHECLADFLNEWDGKFDKCALDSLIKLGERKFESISAFPELTALWWPRFLRIADWFVSSFENERSKILKQRYLECRGSIEVPSDGSKFELTGRADRIDRQKNGNLSLLDYKTGYAPSLPQVESLISPQLPLEAVMLERGGFEEIKGETAITELAYVVLKGGRDPGSIQDRTPKEKPITELTNSAFQQLQAIVRAYQNPEMGYLSRARVLQELSFSSPYDHLARVQEWSVGIDYGSEE